jgi:hypothetical protein
VNRRRRLALLTAVALICSIGFFLHRLGSPAAPPSHQFVVSRQEW